MPKSAAQEFADAYRLPAAEAAAYMAGRDRLKISYDWRDVWREEHAQQFTVSRLARLDLLQSIREQITRSVGGDLTRRDYMRNGEEILAKAGWWGEKTILDPETGEAVTTTFNPARLKLIFDVNTRVAYAAGQWERIQRTKAMHPYIRYVTKGDERVRASHKTWNNLVLPVDHPFWLTHWPPNGWRCRCRVVAISQRDYDRGLSPTGEPLNKTAPEDLTREWVNDRTGEILDVPVGVDPGFAYNPGVAGARAAAIKKIAEQKLSSVPRQMARAAADDGLFTGSVIRAQVDQFVQNAVNNRKVKQPPQIIGRLPESFVAMSSGIEGITIAGKDFGLDHDYTVHAMTSHGSSRETLRGQIAISAGSFVDIFDGLSLESVKVELGDPPKSRNGATRLKVTVEREGVLYEAALEVRRKMVVVYTMWMRKT